MLGHTSRDEEGYPGTLTATVTYALTADNQLKMEYTARTDARHLELVVGGEGVGHRGGERAGIAFLAVAAGVDQRQRRRSGAIRASASQRTLSKPTRLRCR